MMRRSKALRLLGGAALVAAAGALLVPAIPANAQFFDRSYPSLSRQRGGGGGGFFDGLFGGGGRQRPDDREIYREAPADYSRAPAARKDTRADQVEPTTSIVVLGDSMADWLASGLEDAFGDAPEIAVVRKNKQYSGLLRYDAKNDLDWWHVARDLLANEKASYVVMMIGVGDRQNLRSSDVAKEAEQQAKDQVKDQATNNPAANANQPAGANPPAGAQPGAAPQDQAKQDQPKKEADDEGGIVAPEPKQAPRRAAASGSGAEFRTEAWEKIYTRRIDDTIAALKSKGVPVIWVGLPPIRGAKSTADTGYLNDLYRARAEKAGAIYVDVWDGFVDEEGKYTNVGPDYEGQMRRLRAGDGVYFTKYGARKLAHYVEREVRRLMTNRGPIALPMGPTPAMPADGKSAARPLVGPVVPLTTLTGANDELAGGTAPRADASATAVLVKGDAVAPAPGRADDFIWPPGSERPKVETPVAAPAAAPAPVAPQAAVVAPPAPAPATPKPVTPAALPPAPVAPTSAPAIMAPEPAPQAKPAAVEPAARPAPAQPRAVERPRPPQPAVDNRPRQQQQVFDPRDPRAQQRQPVYDPRDPRAPRPPQGIAQQPRRDDGGLFGLFR